MIEPDVPGTVPNAASVVAYDQDRSGAATSGHGDVAQVLRKAFQAAVDETVPDEMLDLLAKLS